MNRFGNQHKRGRCPISVKCHCLVVDPADVKFYVCCGYYHVPVFRPEGKCNGHLDEWPRYYGRIAERPRGKL